VIITRCAGCRARWPALLAGVALGLSGALMQTLTRNPLADPGILGVNAGAGFAVVVGMTFLWCRLDVGEYLWFAFAGALFAATLLVALIGAVGGSSQNPVRLTLAGVALGGGAGRHDVRPFPA
jgi:ferric enterobactin transport system permease protein